MTFNAGALDNYARRTRSRRTRSTSTSPTGVRKYIDRFLSSAEGGFYVTQDADLNAHEVGKKFINGHEYYAKSEAERLALGIPRVDTHEYPRENGLAISAYCTYSQASGDATALDRAKKAADRILATHALDSGGLVHGEKTDKVIHLSDNAWFAWALLALGRNDQAAKIVEAIFTRPRGRPRRRFLRSLERSRCGRRLRGAAQAVRGQRRRCSACSRSSRRRSRIARRSTSARSSERCARSRRPTASTIAAAWSATSSSRSTRPRDFAEECYASVVRLRFVFACAFAITACALFTNLDDLSAGSGDGGSDVIAPDAPVGDSAGPSTYCSTVDATFCEDFDEPDGGYLERWSTITLGRGQHAHDAIVRRHLVAERARRRSAAGNAGGAALRRRTFRRQRRRTSTRSRCVSSRSTRVPAASIGRKSRSTTSYDAGSVFTEYRFVTYANATNFEAHVYYPDGGNTVASLPLSMTFQPGKWYRVDELLTLAPPAAKVRSSSTTRRSSRPRSRKRRTAPATPRSSRASTTPNPPTGTWRMELDDVVLRAE